MQLTGKNRAGGKVAEIFGGKAVEKRESPDTTPGFSHTRT
jgi:hypothetical protein